MTAYPHTNGRVDLDAEADAASETRREMRARLAASLAALRASRRRCYLSLACTALTGALVALPLVQASPIGVLAVATCAFAAGGLVETIREGRRLEREALATLRELEDRPGP